MLMLLPLNSESMDRLFGTLSFKLLGVGTFFFLSSLEKYGDRIGR